MSLKCFTVSILQSRDSYKHNGSCIKIDNSSITLLKSLKKSVQRSSCFEWIYLKPSIVAEEQDRFSILHIPNSYTGNDINIKKLM